MEATVLHLADHRAVFVLPEQGGTVVFLASRGRTPRLAHENRFNQRADAETFARGLAQHFGCSIIGMSSAPADDEVAA
ncbi:hypothetical protein [Sphingobium nicotianae]|uniref:Uncharacterized protein n=1 Tax=Sphingobium nicotianae TaxID=2782607 RepID=A0A9X1D7X9_9SPHN|nr:hypothetical protein [Sphingobium nicotianae]MBT2185552.1 hypothetical protein [Sphingobium nicotianae]